MSIILRIHFILFFLLILSSCDPYMVYDKYQETEKGIWHQNDIKKFETEIQDSLQSYNLLVNIRHTTDYPNSNLFVFVDISGPYDFYANDTLEILITNERGKWYGYGFGKIKHISRMYKNNVRFPHTGKYIFSIRQGVREPEVPVTDIGFRIEKYKYLK